MSMTAIGHAFHLLREMEKEGEGGLNILGRLGEAVKSIDAAGKGMSTALRNRGHGGSAMAARFLPHAVVGALGYKALKGPVEKMKAWKQQRDYEKAMRQAQQGGYY